MLGTNGGGFFNANSSHPFENPTALTNLIQMLLIFSIGAALTNVFGRMVGNQRQGWAIFAIMALLFLIGTMVTYWPEAAGNPLFAHLPIDQTANASQSGGNMEGKEVRFGIANSALFTTITTDASCGRKAGATVRHAKRLADQLRAPWIAINVETTGATSATAAEQDSVVAAQRLGAEPVLIPGEDVADSAIDYARANNVTHLIVGKSRTPGWRQWLGGSITQRLINRAGGINIHVIEIPAEPVDAIAPAAPVTATTSFDPWPFAITTSLVLATIPVAIGLRDMLGVANSALVFLTAVLISAVLEGLGPSLLACFVAMMAYNFFFLPPLHTFTIVDPDNVVALFFFTVVAVIVSNLAARVRGQALSARVRARQTDNLYQFSRKLAVAVALDDLLWATAHQVALMLKVRVVLLLPSGDDQSQNQHGSISVRAGFPPEDMLDEADLAAAKWSWEKNHIAGRGSDTLPGAKWLFQPLRTGRGPLGVVGIIRDDPGPLLTRTSSACWTPWLIRLRWRSSG